MPNYVQSGNTFQGSSLVGQLLFTVSNKFFSRSCGTSSGRSGSEVVAAVKDVTTGKKFQATEIEVISLCPQAPSNQLHDHAFTDTYKQGGEKEYTF